LNALILQFKLNLMTSLVVYVYNIQPKELSFNGGLNDFHCMSGTFFEQKFTLKKQAKPMSGSVVQAPILAKAQQRPHENQLKSHHCTQTKVAGYSWWLLS
jgi:hypothetical protein